MYTEPILADVSKLMVVGGLVTLTWDNRLFISSLTSHLRPARSPSASSKNGINNVPTGAGVPEVTHHAVQGSSSRTTGEVHSHGCVHQRTRPLYPSPEHGRPDMGERTPLLTLGAKPAIAMTVAFVALVVTFVVIQIAAQFTIWTSGVMASC